MDGYRASTKVRYTTDRTTLGEVYTDQPIFQKEIVFFSSNDAFSIRKDQTLRSPSQQALKLNAEKNQKMANLKYRVIPIKKRPVKKQDCLGIEVWKPSKHKRISGI